MPMNINNNQKSLIFLLLFIFIFIIVILKNIIFLRQIFGFLYLAILPGFLIISILKLNKLEFTEKAVLIVGLSASFLIIFGLIINNLSLLLGYLTPLSTISLLISFNIVFMVLAVIGYRTNNGGFSFSMLNFNLNNAEKTFLTVPIFFPVLSILGTYLMKTANNNIVLVFLLFLIPIYVVFVCFFNHKFPKRLYPAVIFSISISLLLIFMLRFPHIYGHDVHTEYGIFFQTTLDSLHWSTFGHNTLDACLSISLLPTIFQSIMDVNAQEYLFKGVYVFICSFSPLAVYITSKKYVGELYAFLASFFFISQYTFLIVAGSPRTNLAIFFVALVVMVIFNDKIDLFKRRFLTIIFIFSLLVSHYATTYIFFFMILFTWFVAELLSKKYSFKKCLSSTLVLIFSAFVFLWYSQLTEVAFTSGITFIERTVINLNNLFILESRQGGLEQLAAQDMDPHLMVKARFVITWGSFILIGIGVLTMLKRFKEMTAISNIKLKKPDFLKKKIEMEYLVLVLGCSVLLVAEIVIPFIASYEIQRVYSLMMIILSVCFVIGGITLSKTLSSIKQTFKKKMIKTPSQTPFLGKKSYTKRSHYLRNNEKNTSKVRAYLVILLVLIPYSMFQTGVVYQIYGSTLPVTLNPEGEKYDREYIHDSESYAAMWLMMNGEKNSRIYITDGYGSFRLLSQGKITRSRICYLPTPIHEKPEPPIHEKTEHAYIYLYYDDVVNKLVAESVTCNLSEYFYVFIGKSKIYDTNGAEIYK